MGNCKKVLLFALMLISLAVRARQKPIALNAENPHYFSYRNQPTVLITSGEHYGAILNLDFNYLSYLQELQRHGLNHTRTFTGAYVEHPGAFFIVGNTLAPAPGRMICPWKRSTQPGYQGGGNKFDLTQWDEAYFKRLKDFLAQAQKRNIIVELTLFCTFYENDQWKLSPLHAQNNINGIGMADRNLVYTLDQNKAMLGVQEKMVQKIVAELQHFPNLIYEICNEPYFNGVTMQWQHHIAQTIKQAEKDFKYPHLISQNIANNTQKIKDPHPEISVFNFHYATPPVAVADNYHLQKVIGDNETGFKGNDDETYRMQGWLFLLAGGGMYNNLDYSFSVGKENGTFAYPKTQPGGGSTNLRRQLGYLKRFMDGLDFIAMRPDLYFIKGDFGKQAQIRAMSSAKEYAIYLYGQQKQQISFQLPAGKYHIRWMNTLSGEWEGIKRVSHQGGRLQLAVPAYQSDIALSIKAR